MKNSYITKLIQLFEANKNDENAFWMKKYMRNQFEYYGIKTPMRKELAIAFFREAGLPKTSEIEDIIDELWKLPQREYQYFADTLLFKMIKELNKKHIKLFERMIANKSWWDTVDYIAVKLVGKHFENFPEIMPKHIEAWNSSGNIWLNRTAILFQLQYKKKTNVDLLLEIIEKHAGSREFFIQKAIGWALREYSKTEENAVRKFVMQTNLSPLSKREALKWLNRK